MKLENSFERINILCVSILVGIIVGIITYGLTVILSILVIYILEIDMVLYKILLNKTLIMICLFFIVINSIIQYIIRSM